MKRPTIDLDAGPARSTQDGHAQALASFIPLAAAKAGD
jgi:hypothetical protein